MSSSKFGKFFGGSYLPKKNQSQAVNTNSLLVNVNENKKPNRGYFERLVGMGEERKYIREIGENILYRVQYFSNHADIFYKFTEMSEEAFKSYIVDIKSKIEGIMEYGGIKEINKMKMLNDWLVQLEKLLDDHLLHPLDLQCQEMFSLLLRHANKAQTFNASNPEDFKAFLQEMKNNYRLAKSQIAVYASGETDIRIKNNALTALLEVSSALKSLKGALNKQLSKVRVSANQFQEEFDQSYHQLLLHMEHSTIFANEDPEIFKEKLDKMKDRCIVASSQIQKYLSGADSSEEKKRQALKILEKSLADIKAIEQKLLSVFDVRSRVDTTTLEIQHSYKWLFEHAEQSPSFANEDPKAFKENLKCIRSEHKHACVCIEKYLSGKNRDEANYLQALQELEGSFGEIKELEGYLDTFLLNKLNDTMIQTYNKLLKYVDQSSRFRSLQRQDFVEDLKDLDKRREQAKSAIETYLTETDVNEQKREVFRVLEEIEQELDLALANEINAEIMYIRNRLDKYQPSITAEERERDSFKDRLERIENLHKDANAKIELYLSGKDITKEDKYAAFQTLEECLEKMNLVEIDMTPFLKGPMIKKIDQAYVRLLQNEDKYPIFDEKELPELDQAITDAKNSILIDAKNDPAFDNASQPFMEDFDKLNKLERRISLYLRLQVLHHNHLKISSSVEKYLNNTTKFNSEEKKKIRKYMDQNVANTNIRFEKVKNVLKGDNSPMRLEYLGELSLNEYHKSIELLKKQASQVLGCDISSHPSKSELKHA